MSNTGGDESEEAMVTVVHAPKNEMPRIDCIWAFLSVDEADGNEGVVAAPLGDVMTPFIAADEKRVERLMPLAKEVARVTGRKIRLVKFHTRELLTEFGGQ